MGRSRSRSRSSRRRDRSRSRTRRDRSRSRDRKRDRSKGRRKSRSRSSSRDSRSRRRSHSTPRRRRKHSSSRSRERRKKSSRSKDHKKRSKSRHSSSSRSKSVKKETKKEPKKELKTEEDEAAKAEKEQELKQQAEEAEIKAKARAMAASIKAALNVNLDKPPPPKYAREGEVPQLPTVGADEVDPLDAFMQQTTKKAQKDLIAAREAQRKDDELIKRGLALQAKSRDGMDAPDIIPEQSIANFEDKAKEVCFACKEIGHNQVDCPNLMCNHCKKRGHKRAECPDYTETIKEEAKEKKREKQKEAKRRKKMDDWTTELRQKSGVVGFAALYKILELPERKLATLHDIKQAYHRLSLKWHPDKHPDNLEEATEKFLGIKAAYELLEEGIRTGGAGMGGAVFSAGDLFAPGQKKGSHANQGGVILLN